MKAARLRRAVLSSLRGTAGAAILVALIVPARAAVPGGSEADVHRLLTLLSAVGEEYREGVRDGAIAQPIEFEEAKSFFADARQRLQDITRDRSSDANDIEPLCVDIAAAIDRMDATNAVAAKLAELRQRVVTLTGVSEQVYPPDEPSAARGKSLFDQYCATCHGERGDGKGPGAASLNPSPADFTDPHFIHGETPYDFYHVISLGKRNTAMPAWDGVLSVQDRWDLISYVWTLAPGAAGIAEGQGVYLAQCASCHGATGDGQGAFSRVLVHAAPDLRQAQALARRTDADLFAAATHGVAATPMPSFDRVLSEDDRWKAVAFLRLLSLGGPPRADSSTAGGPGESTAPNSAPRAAASKPGTVESADAALAESARLLDEAVAAYALGDDRAAATAGDAYLQFEPIEPRLGATEPGLKTRVEERFLHLRQALRGPDNNTEVRALAAAIHADFSAVHAALQPHTSPYAVFAEAATIILREGFEIVLVIGALIAYVVKTGNAAMRRAVHIGTLLGIAASLATAFILGEMLQLHPSSSDVLEGVTMLLAAVVLFWVSYWLISKAEADKWQQYIRGKVQTAVRNGGGVALAGAAFLAVYREGFETVLFYQALYASAPADTLAVIAGFFVGAVALGIVYLLFRRFEVQIPIRQFFFATGLLLYGMAAIFAGQGVHELQEAGLIAATPVAWVPTVPLLGLFPSVQSLAVQAVFVVLLVYATVVTLRRRRQSATRAPDPADVVAELRALRHAVEAVRQELATLHGDAPSHVGAIADRVEGVLVQVERLATQVSSTPGNGRTNGGGQPKG